MRHSQALLRPASGPIRCSIHPVHLPGPRRCPMVVAAMLPQLWDRAAPHTRTALRSLPAPDRVFSEYLRPQINSASSSSSSQAAQRDFGIILA